MLIHARHTMSTQDSVSLFNVLVLHSIYGGRGLCVA